MVSDGMWNAISLNSESQHENSGDTAPRVVTRSRAQARRTTSSASKDAPRIALGVAVIATATFGEAASWGR